MARDNAVNPGDGSPPTEPVDAGTPVRASAPSSAPLIVVVGPTAAGKSSAAIEIAERYDAEIVSADAFQVYRRLDIGTGKVGPSERARVPHHCLDIVDPEVAYNAGDYARDAMEAIEEIRARDRRIVVAGGTGLYIRALVEGLAPLPRRDPRWRRGLERLEARRGLERLYAMLRVVDPAWAAAVGPADRPRIFRGLEVTLRQGIPMSTTLARANHAEPRFEAVWLGIEWPREALYRRIERRVDAMLAAGWLDEVADLRSAGYGRETPAMRAIGYRQLAAHLAGEIALEPARDEIVRATRRYAKRQLTWFRRQAPCAWFSAVPGPEPSDLVQRLCSHLDEKLSC